MYTITSSDDSANDPKNWVLKGSKDGDTWIVIDKRENESFLWKYHTRSFSVGSTELFNFFRLEISENNGGGKIALGELELLGK